MAAPIIDLNGRWGGKLREQNLHLISGDDATLQVTTLETDDTVKDLTGGAVSWVLSRRPGTNAWLTKTGTLTSPTTGVFTVAVDSTADLSGEYYHEAQLTESGGAVGTVMRGWVMIDKDSA
jgi:hypothetical protein